MTGCSQKGSAGIDNDVDRHLIQQAGRASLVRKGLHQLPVPERRQVVIHHQVKALLWIGSGRCFPVRKARPRNDNGGTRYAVGQDRYSGVTEWSQNPAVRSADQRQTRS